MSYGGTWTKVLGLALGLVVNACGATKRNAGEGQSSGGSSSGGSSNDAGTAGAVTELNSPFTVSDHFAPGIPMGDAGEPGHVTQYVNEQCKERPSGARGDCYRFTYEVGGNAWAGYYWVYPPSNAGSLPGRPVSTSELTRVAFQSAVQRGPQLVTFFIGGIDGRQAAPPQPYADQFEADTSVMVTEDWQRFEIELPPPSDPSVPITSLIGAFGWAMNFNNEDPATAPAKTLYLDDIVYE